MKIPSSHFFLSFLSTSQCHHLSFHIHPFIQHPSHSTISRIILHHPLNHQPTNHLSHQPTNHLCPLLKKNTLLMTLLGHLKMILLIAEAQPLTQQLLKTPQHKPFSTPTLSTLLSIFKPGYSCLRSRFSIYLSTYLSIYPSIYLSIYLAICLLIYQSSSSSQPRTEVLQQESSNFPESPQTHQRPQQLPPRKIIQSYRST